MITVDETININDLCARTSKNDTLASVAVLDMIDHNAIYQSQKDFDYYTIHRGTFDILRYGRFEKSWDKEKGLSFKWMYSQSWRKVKQ